MKLGILVVYLIDEGVDWLLDKHLIHLSKTRTSMEFRLYAAANRLHKRHIDILRNHDFVEVVNLPNVPSRMNAEHGTYLDLLAEYAIREGCDFICTFDVDSWPIREDWPDRTVRMLEDHGVRLAAVLRAENGDHLLPHPSFTFLDVTLLQDPLCRFWPSPSAGTREAEAFLTRAGQRVDTGFGLAYCLARNNLNWIKLLRSNSFDHHYLMAGIYHDLIFHLGASSRRKKFFSLDHETWATTLVRPVSCLPWAWRAATPIIEFLERLYEPRIYRENEKIYQTILSGLRSDERGFYEKLSQTWAMLLS